jgi:hypothetical protein
MDTKAGLSALARAAKSSSPPRPVAACTAGAPSFRFRPPPSPSRETSRDRVPLSMHCRRKPKRTAVGAGVKAPRA